jgi:hypothetical protein
MSKQQILGRGTVLGVLVVLSVVAVGALRHRSSIQGDGIGLLRLDVSLLFAYGLAGVLVSRQRGGDANIATMVGAQLGLFLGAVLIANHLIEAFVPVRPFLLIIGPVLLMITLLGAAGAAAYERTRSLVLAVTGGLWCAIVATLIALSFACSFNLLFLAHTEWLLHEAFAASGMTDPGSFVVKNILEAASEFLVRMPIFAVCLSFTGALVYAWLRNASRRTVVAASFLSPIAFAAGAYALWHANTIERAARPPFVMSGVLLSGIALCAAYPIWSVLHGPVGMSRDSVNC